MVDVPATRWDGKHAPRRSSLVPVGTKYFAEAELLELANNRVQVMQLRNLPDLPEWGSWCDWRRA